MIGRLLGHTKVATTARYAHLVRDEEKAAAGRVGDSIGVHVVPRIAAPAKENVAEHGLPKDGSAA